MAESDKSGVTGADMDRGEMLATQALQQISKHEVECSERYRQIVSNQNISTQDREKLRAQLHEQQIQMLTTLGQHKTDLGVAISGVSTAVDHKIDGIKTAVDVKIGQVNSRLLAICLSVLAAETLILVGVVAWFMNFKIVVQP